MIKLYRKLFFLALLSGFLFVSAKSFAQVSFTGGVSPDMCVGNSSYVSLNTITITETNILDFSIDGTPGTIIIAPSTPSLFQFEPGIGSISFTGLGDGSVTAVLTVTATQIIIELSESDADNETDINSIIISGIQVRAINSPASLQLQNVGGSGSFTINGFSLGDDITSSMLESFAPPTTAAAGTDRTGASAICGTSTPLAANTPAIGDGEWSFVSNPDGLGVISSILSPTSSFSGTPGQTYELQWTISNGPCTPSTDNVLIHFDPTLSAAVAGDDQDVCGTVTSLTATTPATGVGTWSFVSNPDALGAIGNVNSATSLFSGAAGSTYVLRWTVTGGSCGALQDDVTIKFIAPPTVSQAGSNQNLCETLTFTLAANAPAVGEGAWTVIAGTATVTSPLSPTSTVTGIPIGSSATLRWRITNGACPASISDVILHNYQTIPDTDAGLPFIDQCNNATFVMNASAATGSNTGSWSVVSGSASITNLNLPTTTVTGVAAGSSVTLRWTVSNGGICTDKWDEIVLTNYLTTSIADAGADIHLCNTSTFPMAATAPAVGTGEWSLISGTATITDESSSNTTVTGVPVGTSATLRWTVSNGICGGSIDEVVITNHPTVPDTDAGVALFEQCNNSTFIMAADPAGSNTGTWTIVSGSATITNINSHTTTVTGVALGSTVTLRWTVSNGVCPDKSDDIVLQNHRLPTLADAGVDIDQCNTSTFNLNGNLPTYGIGVWSLVSGTATITDVNLRTTTVTGVADGTSVTLRWTISNGSCIASTDDVVLYNRGALPAVDAGPVSIIQCNTSIFEMNASNPAPGIGTWSLVSGTASITNINSPTTTVTGVPAGSTAVLRWTISNGGICSPVSDDISLVNQQLPTTAIATSGASPINQCDNTTFTMSANSPTIGTGSWSVVSGSATITNLLSPTTTITGVTAGASATLRWSITNGTCPASTSDVVLSNYGTPPIADAGLVSIIQCNSSTFTMTANSTGSGVGTWTVVSGIATITNTTSASTTITEVPLGTSAVLRWTITSPVCPTTFDDILLTNDRPPSVANAGFDINQGASSTFTLNAQSPVYGTGVWTIISGDPGVTITNPVSPTSTVTGVLAGTSATLRWTVSNGSCPPSVDDVVLTNYATPPVADAGPPFMSQCDNSTFVMVANDAPLPASGLWTIQSGSATITNSSLHTTTVTGVAAGTSVVLRWTISDGVNPPTFDQITLTNFLLPSAAVAGPDIQQCNNSNFTMNATPPTIGTGVWSIVNGTAAITTNTNPTTTVTGIPVGTSATLRWTVSNGVCLGVVDDIVLTNFSTPNSAEAGPAVLQQCNTSTFVMSAISAGSGIGEWTLQSGVATITNINSPTTTITDVPVGSSAVLRWTVGNGVCASTFDEITLTNFQAPSVSNAGLDINQCSNDTFTLDGNVPAIGTGEWTIVSGPGVITTSTLHNTTVTGVTAGSSTTLRWTITNGVCAGSVDDVVLTNRITPPAANAGLPSITQCNNSTFTMNANPPSPGVGEWTIVSGSATIINTSSRTTTVTNVVAGTSVTLRWTISNGGVCAPTSDDIVLTNDLLPTPSNAGLDINQCSNDTFTLDGNVPAIGTGTWTIVSGPGVITTSTLHNTTVTGVIAGSSTTLRWTITNGVCAGSVDDVVLTNRITPPIANAGLPSITQCNNSTFTMNANPPSPGVGEWTIVSGSATIINTSSRTTTVTNVVAGTSVTLRWTISNGGVCAPTSDDIILTNDLLPTPSNAGLDINQCSNDTFTLDGNVPTIGTGTWTIVSGPGVITSSTLHNTTVTGVTAGSSTTLRWTITNGVCAGSVDDVILTNRITPPVADAHPSPTSTITQCNNGTFTMNANAPSPGVGEWTIVSGTATITNTSSRTTTVTGIAAGTIVVLRWTISNGGVCPPTSDDVTLINDQLPTVSNAGLDINQCNNDSFTLDGNIPSIGTGVWTIVSGSGVITNSSAYNTTVTGVTAGMSTTLRWTITNGSVCVPSTDDVVLTNRIAPPTADADEGSPVTEQCNNSTFVMSANAPIHGTGLWTIVTGSAVITNASSPTTTITGVGLGTSVTLRWTISNGGVCPPTSDDIVLTNYSLPSTSNAGLDISQCEDATFTLAGNIPTYGTGVWTIVSGPGVITTSTLHNTTVTGVTAGSSTTLRWTITNGVCAGSIDDVVLTNRITPPAADAGLTLIEQCNNSTFIMTANDPVNGIGAWTIVSGSAVITNPNSYTTTITSVMPGTTVVLRWTISNGGVCTTTSDDITLTNFHQPTTALAGPAQFKCNDGSFTLAANTPVYGIGTWSIIGASNGSTVTTIGSPISTVTGLQAGTSVTLRWTISNGMCTSTTNDVVLTNTLGVIVDAGSNVEICEGTTFNFSSQATLASASNYATLLWESVGTLPTGVLYNAATLSPTYQPGVGETGLLHFRLTATGMGVCAPVSDVMEIMITPKPLVNAGSDEQICEGTTTLDFATRTIPASSAYGSLVWTHTGSGSLSSSTILNPVYTVGLTDVGTTITFTLTVTSGSPTVCSQVVDEFTLKVNPTTVVTIPGGDFSVCEPATIDLVGEMQGSAIAGSWSIVSGAGGTLSVSSITVTGNIKTVRATYTRLPSEINTVLTFRLTSNDPDDAGPCSPVYADVNVTVDESAKVFAGADMNICEYNPIPLSGTFSGTATSVTWSGGLSSDQFNAINNKDTHYNLVPSEVNVNNLSYVFTLTTNDPTGVCPAVSDDVLVTIIDRLPSGDITIIGLNAVYAENDPFVPMIGVPGGGVFTGDAVSGNSFFPNIAHITPLTNTVFYSVTDIHGCVSTHSRNVVVNPITELKFFIREETALSNGKFMICAKQGNVLLIETPDVDIAGIPPGSFEKIVFSSPDIPDPDGNIFYDNSSGVESFVLKTDNLVAGEYHIIMSYTNDLNATNSYERIYIVASSPVSVIDNNSICETSQANFIESSYIDEDPFNPTGATITEWLWDFGDGNGSTSRNPVYNYPAGVYNIKLKVTTNEGCTNESTKVINVGSTPEMRFDWTEFCNGSFTNFVDQTIVSVGSIINYKWTFGDGYEIGGPAGSTIPPGSNDGYTEGIIAKPKHEYQAAGQQYNITLEVQTDVGCIESITRTAFILEYETPSPIDGYFEDFEAGSGSWFANRIEKLTPTDTSWVFGTPAGSVINSAASGNNAWWTGRNPNAGIDLGTNKGIEATYFNNEKSAVIGPCQDLSGIKRPMISIDYWSDTQLGSDGAVLQYSINGGIDWQAIGEDTGSGINWYNGRAITGNPGAQLIGQFGWTGNQALGWRTARYNLDQIDPDFRSQIIFRIAFGSNNDNGNHTQTFNGFAFDNVYIGEKKRTVMVEYFTNAGILQSTNEYFDNLYDQQMTVLLKDSSDFFKVQYHIANPTADAINQENPVDPAARSLYYGVSQPPSAIMDGILGNYYGTTFNGNHQRITTQQIDRRALEDPLFDIEITNMVADPDYTDSLKFRVNFKYVHPTQALSNPVTYQVALLEDSVNNSPTNRNVLRKFLLGTEGKTVNQIWTYNQEDFVDIKTAIDVPVGTNNKRLYLVAFVQDRRFDSKIIHQAIIQRAPVRSGKIITGVDDDPILAQVKDINVYPNPASRVINFATEQPLTRDYEWSIIDQRGVTVLAGKLDHDLTIPQQVELKGIADGVYIVAIKQGNRPLIYRKIAVLKRG